MLHQILESCVASPLLQKNPLVWHAYSTRYAGDMHLEKNRTAFLNNMGKSGHQFVLPEQVHGNDVYVVAGQYHPPVQGIDGLVMRRDIKNPVNYVLGVVVADCIPLLFADRRGISIGVAHAGWKGTLGKIALNMVGKIIISGANPHDIIVSIGPHIGMCCYTIPEERAMRFIQEFGNDSRVAYKSGDGWHLDIGYVNVLQLESVGIPSENIDLAISCTSCQNNKYYSYRKDTHRTFGEMLACIGFN
jgi:polyphenol oxidase